MGGFEEIEHTADYALHLWGRDLRELIESAGRGLVFLLLGEEPPGAGEERMVEVEGSDGAVLVMRSARELLHMAEDGEMPVSCEVAELEEERGRARLRVGWIAEGKLSEPPRAAIKAVTYHDLEIEEREGRLEMRLTFDT